MRITRLKQIKQYIEATDELLQTADGVHIRDVQHLWITWKDKVHNVEDFESMTVVLNKLSMTSPPFYSTKTAATLALIQEVKERIATADCEKLRLTNLLFKLESDECVTMKISTREEKKLEKIGNIRI